MIELTPLKARTFSMLGQRGAIFGVAALDSAKIDSAQIILTADLATLSGLSRYITNFPDKFINVGIAEQNMLGIAAGLSAEGFHPIVTTYATFITMRSCEQIRHYLGYMGLKVVVIGSGAGLIQGYSGNTHYTIEDVAILRSMPNIKIVSPADAGSAVKLYEEALKSDTSVYIRLTGGLNCPVVYKSDVEFVIGKAIEIQKGNDVLIYAMGTMVSTALKSAKLLEENNLSVTVVDMHSVKPIDEDYILSNMSYKLIVTIEEHNVLGGLGAAICEVVTSKGCNLKVLRLGINDIFNMAGDYNNLIDQNRLHPTQIKDDILSTIKD